VTDLPEEVTAEMLAVLFKQYPGYVQARLFADKHIAFVEYDTVDQAAVALKGLNGFIMSQNYSLKLSYARV